ncbi:hypothetical protein ACI65C_004338 [Semiaphis heraclei]
MSPIDGIHGWFRKDKGGQRCVSVYRRDDDGAVERGKRYRDGRGALSGLAAASAVSVVVVVMLVVAAVVVAFRFAFEKQPQELERNTVDECRRVHLPSLNGIKSVSAASNSAADDNLLMTPTPPSPATSSTPTAFPSLLGLQPMTTVGRAHHPRFFVRRRTGPHPMATVATVHRQPRLLLQSWWPKPYTAGKSLVNGSSSLIYNDIFVNVKMKAF